MEGWSRSMEDGVALDALTISSSEEHRRMNLKIGTPASAGSMQRTSTLLPTGVGVPAEFRGSPGEVPLRGILSRKKSKLAWKTEIEQTYKSNKNANHALSR